MYWRIEEEEFVKKYVLEHNKNRSLLYYLFCSKKQNEKNIKFLEKEAMNIYKIEKLERYENEIIIERQRINKLVDEMNNKMMNYLTSQKSLIDRKIKPFKIKIMEYNGIDNLCYQESEIVEIYLEPFKIAFMQKKRK